MTGSFVPDYVLLVFLASCGLFQVAAAVNGIRGLLILPSRALSVTLGLALIIAAFSWFFLSEPRNEPDTTLGLNGNQQFAYFFVGISLGLLFTLVISTLRHRRFGDIDASLPWGLDALRRANYLTCLLAAVREVRTFLAYNGSWRRQSHWAGDARRLEESASARSDIAADGDG